MAENIFNGIIKQIEKGFVKLFYIYKNVLSGKGIETLVMLLEQVQQSKRFFRLIDEHECHSIDSLVKQYIEVSLVTFYFNFIFCIQTDM